MTVAAAALVAFPASLLTIWALLRTPAATHVVAAARADRWHTRSTPLLGGSGFVAGLLAAAAVGVAADLIPANHELFGILGGCAILYVAGLLDDLVHLPPLAKIVAQLGAAAVVLGSGIRVEIVSNGILGTALGVLWLVGMTNAFNLLDNMDGLAATLAAIACAFFAADAFTVHPSHLIATLSLGLCFACLGFLPYNLRLRGPAAVFMGDSGSQLLGFALASFGLASSWTVAGSTVATLLLPILVLAVPILDTTLVTVVRLLEGRPVSEGGRDHTSHRLVYQGLSDKRAVVLLCVVSAALGLTSLAYKVLDDTRITLIGVLLTFAFLLQFGSYLADVNRGSNADQAPSFLRSLLVHRRRLVEVIVDFALITASFTLAFVIRLEGTGYPFQRHVFDLVLPALLVSRYIAFIAFGLYRGVWRYAGARDAVSVFAAVFVSEAATFLFIWATVPWNGFPRGTFLIDLLLCTMLVGASRFWERGAARALAGLVGRSEQRRDLIVGAGQSGRSLLRELRETRGERVVGFVDDDPALHHRRIQGVPVVGAVHDIGLALGRLSPDAVLVTIPDAPRERLDAVIEACRRADIQCNFVRRQIDLDPAVALEASE
ncbi:MAG: UDP-GlcNAc:undecaprenyl-phosphate/decaprenyl-phosphate GlcNAc-phosphate transferase [Gaiellaceae bacterium]|nr:UDP-GlcNAc:undecaprenyl-phosphate/decaprenyl-phosphate GlcNAc-phosphate transferase [Gaiellaceae bacterium]MDX6469232.1 UDP-GlcNAc:undecaprenyl-phosphate/decaprenyl-phosphate GlcNAc-phosphate transferase [Gaiellaceae bacterium]